jgi:hypothetical protein
MRSGSSGSAAAPAPRPASASQQPAKRSGEEDFDDNAMFLS